ncbi:LpqN/LpqT family lipoprotein [Mycolicibacterium sp. CBM1]
MRPLSVAMATALALAVAGCSDEQKPSAAKCEEVSASMADIATRTDQEPRLRVPQPQGWERTTKLDSETIRFAIRNPAMSSDGFTPNAVVTLQKVGADMGKSQQIFDAQNQQLKAKLKVTDLKTTPAQVCGSPAQTSSYTAPAMGKIPARKAVSVAAVYQAGDVNYVTTLTVQAINADNPTYAADSATIIKGFQVLPPK